MTKLYLRIVIKCFLSNSEPEVPPNGVEVVHITKTTAKVKWNLLPVWQPYGIVTGYSVNIVEHTPSSSKSDTYRVPSDRRKFIIYILSPGTKYSVRVAAITSAGVGKFSKPITFVTQGGNLLILEKKHVFIFVQTTITYLL